MNYNCISCSDGYYLNNSFCLNCDSNCLTCSGTATTCLSCKTGYILENGVCVTSCQDGYYLNQVTKVC